MKRLFRIQRLRSWYSLFGLLLLASCHPTRPRTSATDLPDGSKPAAGLIVWNGHVWTGSPDDSTDATAVVVHGARILFVGSDAAAKAFIGPQTRIINAGGRRVIPGMTDSHTHIIGGGLQLARLNLRDVKNRDEFIRAIQVEADHAKRKNQWVLGGRWSTESWPDKAQPNKSWIDPVTGDTPVFLNRMDGHQALVNSAALKLAGIDANGPPDPAGGEIERDPRTREPTGILKESAMDLVEQHIPPPTFDRRYAALRQAMKHANSFGITSIHDMSEPDDLDVFATAHRDHALTVRITSYLSVAPWSDHFLRVERFPVRDEYLRVAGFKGYMDGSLGSRTAYMREPYSDVTSDTKYPRGQLAAMADPFEVFADMIREAHRHGFQTAIHAIGDQSNSLLLHMNQMRGDAQPHGAGLRVFPMPRIEHAQHILESDLPLFGKYGVVASMQPFHKADDGRYAEKAIGRERLKGSYAFRQLVDSGALVIFGSDWPVVTLNPWAGIDAAVNARTLDGDRWLPDHSLTLEEAMRAYTAWPPKAISADDLLGQIRENHLADLVILDDDPFTIPRDRLAEIKVWKTIFDGRIVYERGY